ncbi:MAG TPA: hypothetical protein IAB65_00015 [Candidatus Onthocola stercorigallinarum]|nr:hypothetical protein [Candidatus Onthocola stercorigallinarum]
MVLKEKDFESVMDSALGGINGATFIFSPGANSKIQYYAITAKNISLKIFFYTIILIVLFILLLY